MSIERVVIDTPWNTERGEYPASEAVRVADRAQGGGQTIPLASVLGSYRSVDPDVASYRRVILSGVHGQSYVVISDPDDSSIGSILDVNASRRQAQPMGWRVAIDPSYVVIGEGVQLFSPKGEPIFDRAANRFAKTPPIAVAYLELDEPMGIGDAIREQLPGTNRVAAIEQAIDEAEAEWLAAGGVPLAERTSDRYSELARSKSAPPRPPGDSLAELDREAGLLM